MKKLLPKTDDTTIKVTLSLPERVNFHTILPRKLSISTGLLKESLVKRINLSPAEVREYELVFLGDGRFVFNLDKAKSKEFSFEPFEMGLIQQGARFLDENEMLEDYNFKLAEKFLAIKVETKEK